MTTRRTKIVCTIGPATSSPEQLEALVDAGMNVARINCSHGDQDSHKQVIESLHAIRKRKGVPVAIMLDTQGPEIRLGKIASGSFAVEKGQKIPLHVREEEGTPEGVRIRPAAVLPFLKVGDRVLFDDGYIGSRVVEVRESEVVVEIENSGLLKSGKGVNLPNIHVELPALTNQDIADIQLGCALNVDYIAASFVRSAEDVMQVKNLLKQEGKGEILVISKIENAEAVAHFSNILQVTDGVMIARGDLGVEVPLSRLPGLQKRLLKKSFLAAKPSVTATQMLESMIRHPRPTRAEVSDVANAILDGSGAVMLSGETAIGLYPVETVRTMARIITDAERHLDYNYLIDQHSRKTYHDIPLAVTFSAVKTAHNSDAQAIFTFTESGSTARLLSRLRPKRPIIAMTPSPMRYHQMALYWGVLPYLDCADNLHDALSKVSNYALEKRLVNHGDVVVITAGTPFRVSGTTNSMMLESIGHVLVRAQEGVGGVVYGNAAMLLSAEEKKPYSVLGKILILTHYNEKLQPFLRESSGAILFSNDEAQEERENLLRDANLLHKSVVIRHAELSSVLDQGMLVTVHPEKKLVYAGVVLDT